MIKLHRPPFFHIGLLLSCNSVQCLCSRRSRGMGIPRDRRVACHRAVRACWLAPLLYWAVVVKRRTLARALRNSAMADLNRCTELSLRAFNAVLDRSLPVCRALLLYEALVGSRRGRGSSLYLDSCSRTNGVDSRARRGCNPNAVRVVF